MNTQERTGSYAISLLIAASAMLVALSGCAQLMGSRSGTSGAAPGVATGSNANSTNASAPAGPLIGAEPGAVVANAHLLLRSQTAYRVRSTSTTSMGGEPQTSLQEVVAPDRMHNVGDGHEVIVIGRTMYVKKGDTWQNMGTQMSDMTDKMKKGVQDMSPEERAAALKGLSADYKALADELLDGVPTAVYEL